MQMIHAIVTISITTHPHKRPRTKLRFKQGLHQYSALNCHELADSNKHAQLSVSFFAW